MLQSGKIHAKHLRIPFYAKKVETLKKEYKRQRNFCSDLLHLLQKAKKDYFTKLDISSVTDSKTSRQNVKPLSSNKVKFHRILI